MEWLRKSFLQNDYSFAKVVFPFFLFFLFWILKLIFWLIFFPHSSQKTTGHYILLLLIFSLFLIVKHVYAFFVKSMGLCQLFAIINRFDERTYELFSQVRDDIDLINDIFSLFCHQHHGAITSEQALQIFKICEQNLFTFFDKSFMLNIS